MNCKICVIGGEALLFPFLQFGFTTFAPANERELREYVNRAVVDNYGIIYIEDALCFKIADILNKYKGAISPVFVPIGDGDGGTSYSQAMVREMMEKAVGRDIL